MKTFLAAASLAAAITGLAPAAQAATVVIDFSGHTAGQAIDNTYASYGLTFSGATFEQCGGGCPAPNPNGWFAIGDQFTAYFSTPQSNISFQSVSFSSTLAQAYDASNQLLASVTDNENFPISEAVNTLTGSNITYVTFSYGGGQNGPAITNLTFNAAGAVPEPATWAMFILGFGAIGVTLRKSRRGNAVAQA